MKTSMFCIVCFQAGIHENFEFNYEIKNDSLYEVTCPRGHKFNACISYHPFQKLFDVGINALVDGYHRESVGAFMASYERFLEWFIRVVTKSNGIQDQEFVSTWSALNKLSERQLGAFIAAYLLEFGEHPPVLARGDIELRNKVIHQGYFPDKDRCVAFGQSVAESMRAVLRKLRSSQKHENEVVRSINDHDDYDNAQYFEHAWCYICTNGPAEGTSFTMDEMMADALQRRGASPYSATQYV